MFELITIFLERWQLKRNFCFIMRSDIGSGKLESLSGRGYVLQGIVII